MSLQGRKSELANKHRQLDQKIEERLRKTEETRNQLGLSKLKN